MDELKLLREIAKETKTEWDKGRLSLKAVSLKNLLTDNIENNIRMNTRTLNDILLEVQTVQLIDNTPEQADEVAEELTALWQETLDFTNRQHKRQWQRISDLEDKLTSVREVLDA